MFALTTKLTRTGIECYVDTLGKVATINRITDTKGGVQWDVMPYALPPSEWLVQGIQSMKAAETFALAIAYETYQRKGI